MTLPFLAGCGSSEPDCGSTETQSLVEQIVKEHVPAELLDAAAPATKVPAEIARDQALAPYDAQIQALQNQLNKGSGPEIAERVAALETDEVNKETTFLSAIKREKEAQKSRIESAKADAVFSLDLIRDVAKNKDTGAVECAAKLVAKVPGFGEASQDIVYIAERTTEGKPYVTLEGSR